MLNTGKTKSIMLGMAFVVVSLASSSVFIDWSARGNAMLSAWDEMAGLFAFGYHPVSATEWAALSNATEPICPESDLPGRQYVAAHHTAEVKARSTQPSKILTAEIIPVHRHCRKENAPTLIAAVSRESDESLTAVAYDDALPVYDVDFAELASYEEAAEVEDFTARASEVGFYEIDLKHVLHACEQAVSERSVFRLAPAFLAKPTMSWIDLVFKMRLRKEATPAPVTCGP
ncbi:MAG TPA: hypothetical protein VID27_14795 [Blastocatellia bacterium]|jgi:hypothetical protein